MNKTSFLIGLVGILPALGCAFTCGACSANRDTEQAAPRLGATRAPDVRFVCDKGKVVSLFMEASRRENEGGKVVAAGPNGERSSHDMGFVWALGTPCVMESRGLGSQLVIFPYQVGHGTGFATYDWCVVAARRGAVYVKHMGMWKYLASLAGRASTLFELRPVVTTGDRAGLPLFDFVFEQRSIDGPDAAFSVTSGRVLLDIGMREGNIDARLIPRRMADFNACLQLLSSDEQAVRAWAAATLKSICPNRVAQHTPKANRLTQAERAVLLEGMRSVAKAYYAKQTRYR